MPRLSAREGDSDRRRWEFESTSVRLPPEVREERARRLLDALRAGSGLSVAFELVWETGRDARLALETRDPSSARWVSRCLVPSYGPHEWTECPTETDTVGVVARRFLAADRSVEVPFAEAVPAPWSEAVLSALRVLPNGCFLRWGFRSMGPPTRLSERSPDLEGRAQPPGFRLRPLTMPEREFRDRQERRRRSPWWEVRAEAGGTETTAGRQTAARLEALVRSASARGGGNRFRFVAPVPWIRSRPPALFLAEGELAALLPASTTRWVGPRRSSEPELAGLAMGTDEAGDLVLLPVPQNEGRHLAIIGETGMGKSSTLVRLALEAASCGSLILFDPIGDTGRSLLGALRPVDRERAVWVSPRESPIAIDVLASLRASVVGAVAADRALGDLVDALRRVRSARYADTPFWGPRIEETVRRALLAAAALPSGTLRDAERLLAGTGRRPVGIPPEARDAVEELWTRARERPDEVDGSRRLLAELTGRPALMRMLSASAPRFTLRGLFEPGRITVLTGEAAELGESTARYLLSVYLALLWAERLAVPGAGKTFLFLDEAQWYAHETVGEMLRLGRRANLHVVLATQSLRALPEPVAEAVRTNCSDFLLFRGAPEEARDFSRWVPGVSMEGLLAQPRGRATALLGKGSRVVILTCRPPREVSVEDRAAGLRQIRSNSEPYWSPAESAPPPSGPADGRPTSPTESSGSETGPSDRVRWVLLALWAALLDAPGLPSVRVHLTRLRAAVDPDGSSVREAGRRLHEAGVLSASDRDVEGTYWEVTRAGFEALLRPGVDPGELAEITTAWRGAARGTTPSPPTQFY